MVNGKSCVGIAVSFALLLGSFGTAQALARCPPREKLRLKAVTIVEARLKSLFIGESGLLTDTGIPTRMVRADLEIKDVIKGKFSSKEAVALGFLYPPGPYQALSLMAMLYGTGADDTFELELSRTQLVDDIAFYALNDCIYYKFPGSIEKQIGWHDNPEGPGSLVLTPSR